MLEQPPHLIGSDLDGGPLTVMPNPHRVEPEGADRSFGPVDPNEELGRDAEAQGHA